MVGKCGTAMEKQQIVYKKSKNIEGVELLFCSDARFAMPAHTHDDYVFWINCAGGENVKIGGSSDILQPDSFGTVAPGEVHANRAYGRRRLLLSFYVQDGILNDIASQMGCSGLCPSAFASVLHKDRQACDFLGRLHASMMSEAGNSRELFLITFGLLLRRHGVMRSAEAGVCRSPDKVRRAQELMLDRFSESLMLDSVAEECGCTAYHLIRLFGRETGMTPHSWLMDVRVSRARELLGAGYAPGDVAVACGFSDQSHLNRRFKARFGVTPGVYRSQVFSG